jgi:3'(2'), 5'-bisphosphate nucleotidase
MTDPAALLDPVLEMTAEAGATIMDVVRAGFEVVEKEDSSPVTIADQRAEAILLAALKECAPGIPVVAEEQAAAGETPDVGDGPYFLVDPLDGTKEFIRGGDSFTVNVALIEDRRPVFGVVYAPATDRLFYGHGAGTAHVIDDFAAGGQRRPMAVRTADPDSLTIVASRSHRNAETEAYLAYYPDAETVSIGSSLKFCLVAAGEADLYPRLGPTMEWDTAAGHAVLLAAGGSMTTLAGAPFLYTKPDFRNGFFLALGDQNLKPVLIAD